jgi:hypothetical protein
VRRDRPSLGLETPEPLPSLLAIATTPPRPVEPGPTTAVAAAPVRPTPTTAPTTAPSPVVRLVVPTPSTPAPVVGVPPGATLVLTISIVSVNGTQIVLLPGTPTPVIPWWQRSESIPEPLVRSLLAGYLHFWDVRSRALVTLEPAPLGEVMAGPPLQAELNAIQNLRGRNQQQRVDVDHAITPLWATEEEGAVVDTLVDRSVLTELDATPEPTSAVQSHTYRMAYRLRRTERGWQIVDFARLDR